MSSHSPHKVPVHQEKLVHALNLIPYFLAHPDATLMEASHDIGRTPGEIRGDLVTLTMCGLPGFYPDDLVDLDINLTSVAVIEPQGMTHALRLTQQEAVALLMSLESLLSVPGLADPSVVESTAAKLRAATVSKTPVDRAVAVARAKGRNGVAEEARVIETIRAAIDGGHTVCFTYRAGGTDEVTHREVSPGYLFTLDAAVYLAAVDGRKRRTFRLDRMSHVEVGHMSPSAAAKNLRFDSTDPFRFETRKQKFAILGVRPEAQWLRDYYPLTLRRQKKGRPPLANLPEGMIAMRIPYSSDEWLIRFVLSQRDRVMLCSPDSVAVTCTERANAALAAYA